MADDDSIDLLELFRGLQPTERAGALMALMSVYCPECGHEHVTCPCEMQLPTELEMQLQNIEDDESDVELADTSDEEPVG